MATITTQLSIIPSSDNDESTHFPPQEADDDGPQPNNNNGDDNDLTIIVHNENENENNEDIISSSAAADDNDDNDDDNVFDIPFLDAFEDDTETFPYGTMSRVASHVTTLPSTTDAAIRLSNTNATTIFVDLGCGVGRVVNRVQEQVPGARCLGIDMCPGEIDQAIAMSSNNNNNNNNGVVAVKYVVDDVFHAEKHISAMMLDDDDDDDDDWNNVVLFLFLIPTLVNSRGFQKLLKGFIDKGAKVVSYCYHPENWRIDARDERMNVNLYQGKLL
jgi:SAM-dependent methyltransferase